ncbi:MAG TPA: hypothetical protein EYP14_17465 [Planctomycetaceae bacterium]|nr:hypothetical protein [Planctomycetaceae bacterium]
MASRRPAGGYTLFELLLVLALLGLIIGLGWPVMRKALIKAQMRDAARQVRVELARARLRAMRGGSPVQFRFQWGGRQFVVAPLWRTSRAAPNSASVSIGPDGRIGSGWTDSSWADQSLDESASLSEPSAEGTADPSSSAAQVKHLPEDIVFADPRQEAFERTTSLSSGIIGAAERAAAEPGAKPTARLDQPPVGDRPGGLTGEFSAAPGASASEPPPGASTVSVIEPRKGGLQPLEWSEPVVFQPNGQTRNLRIRLRGPRGYQIDLYLRGLTGEVHIGPLRRTETPP